MKTNVIIFSQRYIKYDFLGLLLSVLDIRKFYTFLPVLDLPYPIVDILQRYRPKEYNQSGYSQESYNEFITIISSSIVELLEKPDEDDNSKNGRITNPTVMIMADWEEHYGGYTTYYQYLKDRDISFQRWEKYYDIFPYTNNFGNLAEDLVGKLKEVAGEYEINGMIQDVSIKRISVFFSLDYRHIQTYDFRDDSWHYLTYVSHSTGKKASFVKLWLMRASKENPDIMLYDGNDGKKKIRPVVLDVIRYDLEKWADYLRQQEEHRWRAESGWYDNEDDSDLERGCGCGWTCSNCPNVGCPSNEYN